MFFALVFLELIRVIPSIFLIIFLDSFLYT